MTSLGCMVSWSWLGLKYFPVVHGGHLVIFHPTPLPHPLCKVYREKTPIFELQWNSCGITCCTLCSTQRIQFDLWYCRGYVLALLFIWRCHLLCLAHHGHCGPQASCYGVVVTKKCHSCPSSPTSGLFDSLTVFSAAPWLSRSSPLFHLPTSSGPVVAPRNLCWKSCNSSVSPGYIKSSPLTKPAQSLTYNCG